MSRGKFISILFLAMSFLIACERKSHPTGGATVSPLVAPVYAQTPSVSAVAKPSNIEEVAPKIGGALDGAKLFATNCSACHQITGQGVPGAFPPLDGSEYVISDKVDRMAAIMVYGLMGPITVKGQSYSSAMAPLGQLKDEELAAIATYVRGAWSNKAAAVEANVFADVRKKWAQRGPFTIEELGAE